MDKDINLSIFQDILDCIMYEAVSFDLWFTLIYEDNKMQEDMWKLRVASIYNIAKTYRDDITYEDIYRMYYEMRHILMTTHPRKVIEYIVVGLGIDRKAIEKILPVYMDISSAIKPHVNKEAFYILPKLKELGLKIGLTTNTSFTSDMIRRMLDELGLNKYIDAIASSSELGYVKPDKRIFNYIVSQLGVDPEKTIHVGDKYIYDAVGSYLAGLRPVLYRGLWPMYQYYKDFSMDVVEFTYPPNIYVIEKLEELLKLF